MKKEKIIEILEQFQFDKDEYCILGSGALVMYVILEESGDLDLVVNENGFEKIKRVYPSAGCFRTKSAAIAAEAPGL